MDYFMISIRQIFIFAVLCRAAVDLFHFVMVNQLRKYYYACSMNFRFEKEMKFEIDFGNLERKKRF